MATRDIIVIGTSAGGVEALQQIAAGLPSNLRAAVFVVMHVSAEGTSALPAILNAPGRCRRTTRSTARPLPTVASTWHLRTFT